MKTVERRTVRMITEIPDGKPISVYLEQEDVTYIDGERMTAQSVDPVAIGNADPIQDEHAQEIEAVKVAIDDRLTLDATRKAEEPIVIEDIEPSPAIRPPVL